MATEFVAKLTVFSASQLPKTDRLSKIDPYVVLNISNQKFKTKCFEDNDNPQFNEAFFPTFPVASNGGFLSGSIEVSLYDKNTFSDSLVATATVQLDGKGPQDLCRINLPLQYTKSKYTGQSFLLLGLQGFVQTYRSMRRMFAAMPGFFASDEKQACYFPIHESNGMAYLAVEHERGKVDIKVRGRLFSPTPPS